MKDINQKIRDQRNKAELMILKSMAMHADASMKTSIPDLVVKMATATKTLAEALERMKDGYP